MNKFIIFSLVLSAVVCLAQGLGEGAWYGKQEAACISQGGLCIAQSECTLPVGRAGELCPQQAAQGYQCCFGLPKNERRCSMRGGQCSKKNSCGRVLVYHDASDCGADQDCCILI